MPDPQPAPAVERRAAQRFLAGASRLLASTLDVETALQELARLAVPDLADGCAVHIPTDAGGIRLLALVCSDPAVEDLAWEVDRRYPLDPTLAEGPSAALRERRPSLLPELSDALLVRVARDSEHLRLVRLLRLASALTVPLLAHGHILGALTLLSMDTERRFSDADLGAAESAARLVAVALANARLRHEAEAARDRAERAAREADALWQAALAIGGQAELAQRLERLLDAALDLVAATSAEVVLVDEGGAEAEIVATRGRVAYPRGLRQPRGAGLVGEVLRRGAAVRVRDVPSDPRTYARAIAAAAGMRDWIGVPLRDPAGPLGVLTATSNRADAFGAEDERRLSALAELAGTAIREARLRERERQAAPRRAALLQAAQRGAAEADPRAVLRALLDEALALARADVGVVARLDAERRLLLPVANTIPFAEPAAALPVGVGAAGRAVAERRTVLLNDYQAESGGNTPGGPLGLRAALAVPIQHEGRILGALVVASLDPARRFAPQDAELLELLAAGAAAALAGIERARLEGALLTARTAAHHINNRLALTVGYAELLATSPDLPAGLRPLAEEALRGAADAADTLRRMLQIVRVVEAPLPLGLGPDRPILDLERSSTPREPA